MSWDRNDYPDSMKNLNKYVRDKAIDIANAMVEEGYDEGNAIPIAIDQAKDWYEDASNKEKSDLKDKDLTDHHSDGDSGARLQDADVIVEYDSEKEKWRVISKGAIQADSYYNTKNEAIDRAREIKDNRDSDLIIKNMDQ